jgi:MtN3 and saliva related transmembrane protein
MHSPPSLAHHHKHKSLLAGITLTNTRLSRLVDTLAYPIGLVGLASTLPQAYDIWVLGKTEGVSLLTWSVWACLSLFWILYARVHKAHALAFLNTCWFFMHLFVALGILLKR